MECQVAGGDRNVYWLTRSLAASGEFTMKVGLGLLEGASPRAGWAGFRVGVRGWFPHYKNAAIFGFGLEAGVTHDGRLFIENPEANAIRIGSWENLTLTLTYAGGRLTLEAGGARVEREIPSDWVTGGVALVCHALADRSPREVPVVRTSTPSKPNTARGGTLRAWFSNWTLSGTRVQTHPERALGPILFNQFTVARGILKMTAQMAPLDEPEATAELWINGKRAATEPVDAFSSTVLFRVKHDASRDAKYEVRFAGSTYTGVIPKDPAAKAKITAAALTCQNDYGFPHEDIAANLAYAKPDVLFFTGDQVYERNGEYGIQRSPIEAARLDYLRKWAMFGWAWGDLTRNIPCVCLPDDHDVYHGNIWGAGGRKAETPAGTPDPGYPAVQQAADSGGYMMPARWVNMVQRTQSSHLPDLADRAAVDQEITVHFGELRIGGVSFAILEDRKWKSAPRTLLPNADIQNGWARNPSWNAAEQGDVTGAQLLGARQEKFLADWAADWSDGIWMKAAVSATIFTNLCTLPKSAVSDSVTPMLPILGKSQYAPEEKLTADHDSNGWPQTPRNRALKLLRSCLAVHIAGDQHLGSTLQYGIDAHQDGPHAICTPAVSNLFPRRWYPPSKQQFGDHRDGFGNRLTVLAVANPAKFGVEPAALNDRAVGFGLIEFERAARRITLTNWPRWVDLAKPGAEPYPGWPVVISQWDNGLSKTAWVLRLEKKVSGVVQVIHESTGQVAWTLRLPEASDALPVWAEGIYRVKHDRGEFRTLRAVRRA
jgi:hypothetical protein